ncbi:MAG: prepilin-type N-terminal cleavage/methylation domain-containing protein [Candidatus Sumerlaeia bacterium]
MYPASFQRMRAFTLIELLIVVAIIAILAAIAVPNFLEAQTRAKISRAKADMRSIVVALESYRVDLNDYPPSGKHQFDPETWNSFVHLQRLTTPVAYITSIPGDPFGQIGANPAFGGGESYTYRERHGWSEFWIDVQGNTWYAADPIRAWYQLIGEPPPYENLLWMLKSTGPDQMEEFQYPDGIEASPWWHSQPYDPTNGTKSRGDIVRLGP